MTVSETYQLELQVKALTDDKKNNITTIHNRCAEKLSLEKKLNQIKELDFEEIFNFKSDDISIKDYFPETYQKLKKILGEN